MTPEPDEVGRWDVVGEPPECFDDRGVREPDLAHLHAAAGERPHTEASCTSPNLFDEPGLAYARIA